MKSKGKIYLPIVVFSIFFFIVTGVLSEQTSSNLKDTGAEDIVFADFLTVYHSYYKTKQEDEKLREKGQQLQAQIEKEREKIAELEKKMNSGILSEEEKNKLQQDIEEAKRKASREIQEFNLEIESERQNVIDKLIAELRGKISDFGKERGYTVILDKSEVLFSDEDLDVTKDMVDYVNKGSSE